MCEYWILTCEDFVPSCLLLISLDLIQDWISLSGLPVVGCRHLEKTICTLMAVTPIALDLLTSRDGTRYTRANLVPTDLATLKRGTGTTLWMIPQTLGIIGDLRVTHLVLPVGGWTIEMCLMKGLSAAHVLLVFHRRGILALPPLVGLHPHLPLPFARPESDQNPCHVLASVLDRLNAPLLTLTPTLGNPLCDRQFIEVILLVNSEANVGAACGLECVFQWMAFATLLLPLLCNP